MVENKRLTREFSSLGGGLRGATLRGFQAANCVLEVELLMGDQVGRVRFDGVESVRSHRPMPAALGGGRVVVLAHGTHQRDVVRQYEFVDEEGTVVLEVAASACSVTSLVDDLGWPQVFDYWERNWDRGGPQLWTKSLDKFSPGYRGAVSVDWIDREQSRVGFAGILGNPHRRMFEHAIACFQRLDEPRMAAILQSALIVSGAETPELWEAPPTRETFGGLEPLADDLDSLDSLYADERLSLPTADGVENDESLMGTIEYYWRMFPQDFQPLPDDHPNPSGPRA